MVPRAVGIVPVISVVPVGAKKGLAICCVRQGMRKGRDPPVLWCSLLLTSCFCTFRSHVSDPVRR